MAEAFHNLQDSVGQALLPLITSLSNFLTNHVIPAFTVLAGWVQKNTSWLGPLAIVVGSMVVALKAWAIGQQFLNFVLKEGSLTAGGWFTIIMLVAGALIVAYQHSKTFRDIVKSAMGAVKVAIGWVVTAFHGVTAAVSSVISWVRDHWRLLLAIITGPIGAAVVVITSHWSAIKNGFKGVVDWIRTKVAEIVGFFTGQPGKITALASKLLTAG
jgi:phage-related protein